MCWVITSPFAYIMSCSGTGTNPCNCTGARCPKGAGVANTLGFKGSVAACCKFPCPTFPIHHVKICVKVNENTCVKIQQGCWYGTECTDVDWTWGTTDDSWGRKCRVIEWNRKVPKNTFIRIRFCSCDNCSAGCGEGDYDQSLGASIHNALLKFEVDGLDYTSVIQGSLEPGTVQRGCITTSCFGFGDCCTTEPEDDPRWTSVVDIPWGAQVTFGPIGQAFL